MSLRHAKAGLPGSRRWSLTGRLIFLFTVMTAGLLFVSMGLFYLVVIRHSDREVASFMRDKLLILKASLKEEGRNGKAVQDEIKEATISDSHPRSSYVRVLDANSHLLGETRGMDRHLPGQLFPAPADLPVESHVTYDGRWYFLITSSMPDPSGKSGTWLIQMAQDRTADLLYREKLRWALLVILLLGVGGAGIIGFLAVRGGLSALRDMAEVMTRIKTPQLDRRISPDGWPRELQPLATAFDEMLGNLERSFTRLSQFSADLAHEFRTPLSNLRGEAEVALSKPRTVEEYRAILESSLEELQILSRTVDSLLFLARAENPETRIDGVAFDGRRELEAIVEFHEPAASEKDVIIQLEGEGQVTADIPLFRRAISNLLVNAMKYTHSGGCIRVRLVETAGTSLVSVSDTGEGIAAEHLSRIFDRFYRVEKSRHSQANGLGLSIVKSIMTLHGGKIEATSEPAKGSTFTLSFPISGA